MHALLDILATTLVSFTGQVRNDCTFSKALEFLRSKPLGKDLPWLIIAELLVVLPANLGVESRRSLDRRSRSFSSLASIVQAEIMNTS